MPRADEPKPPTPAPALRAPVLGWAGWGVACSALIAAAGAIGGTVDPLTALVLTIDTHLTAGWPAVALLLAGAGLGRLVARLTPVKTRRSLDLRSAANPIGIALALSLIALLGTAGVLSQVSVGCLTAIGVAGLAWEFTTHARRRGQITRPAIAPPPGWLWAGLPGIAMLLVAGASPPGVLWSSEYGGYDVLSYHLQLPKEWAAIGNTRPVEHNVYSFLPGAIEQAYTAILWLRGHSGIGVGNGGAAPLTAAHTFHIGLTILAAATVGSLARRLAICAGSDRRGCRVASTFAGGVVLCTPWTVVVGSLAYNEMGVVLIGAGAMLVACRRGADRASEALMRASVAGGLVAAACLVKPTAMLFVAPPTAILLLRFARLRHWGVIALSGSVAGGAVLSLWLVRNGAITGNPVFPLATEILGLGHWTTEQATRFAEAHAFDGSMTDRLRLLIFADPTKADTANAVARYRGTSNTQWLLAFPAAVVGIALLLITRRSRPIGIGLALCLSAQLIAWLTFTHLQSRFLVPCLIIIGPAVGVGLSVCARPRVSRRLAVAGGAVLCLFQLSALWAIFGEQAGGAPNRALGVPPAVFAGDPYTPELGRIDPVAYINHETPRDARVLLVGGATPLYFDREVIYATVWDRPPVLDFEEFAPDFVLIDDAELARQRASGYLSSELTPAALDELVRTWRPVRSWPEVGVRLYRVPQTTESSR